MARKLYNVINFFLGKISAFFCAFFLLILSAGVINNWVGEALRILIIIWIFRGIPYDADLKFAGGAAASLILPPFILYCGIAVGRFLLRAQPPPFSGRVRLGTILMTISLTIGCASLSLLLIVGAGSYSLESARYAPPTIAIIAAPLLLWSVGVVLPLHDRSKSRNLLDRPFILFLRRFSQFSDRGVISLILRQAPPSKSVVYLTPIRSRAGDWNPFLVGFAGMRFLHPLRGAPITIASSDNEWENVARTLIQHAQLIILDVSANSGAIETEIEMIRQTTSWPKTIFIKDDAAKRDYVFEQLVRLEGAQIIYYCRSWGRALPRMILGFFALMSTLSLPACMPVVIAVNTRQDPTVVYLTMLFGVLAWLWVYLTFFVRPSINREAKTSLRKKLWADRSSKASLTSRIRSACVRPRRPTV